MYGSSAAYFFFFLSLGVFSLLGRDSRTSALLIVLGNRYRRTSHYNVQAKLSFNGAETGPIARIVR